MNWYLKVVAENYSNFTGRARRKEYWMFVLFNSIFQILATCIGFFLGLGFTIGYIYLFAMFIPSFALFVRRLHDINKSGWYSLLAFIPIIGTIICFIFLIIEGDKSENKYGENPKNDFINKIKNKKDNSKANNTFEEEISDENDENLNPKSSKPLETTKVYVYVRNKKTNKPARFTKDEWKSTSQFGNASLYEVLYDYNEKDYLNEINTNEQSIKKSKQSLVNLKKKGLLSKEEYQKKLNNLNQIEFDVFASINDFISNFEKNISGDLLDLKNLYDSKILSSKEYLKKSNDLKLKSIKNCMQEDGISVQLKEERKKLKFLDEIIFESDDKIITENFIGKLKEPKVIKGSSKVGFFISLNILNAKPIIVCFSEGEFVKWNPSKCILVSENIPKGIYRNKQGDYSTRKNFPSNEEMKIINSYSYDEFKK